MIFDSIVVTFYIVSRMVTSSLWETTKFLWEMGCHVNYIINSFLEKERDVTYIQYIYYIIIFCSHTVPMYLYCSLHL